MNVVQMIRTCHACPAQWDGRTDDGRYVYVRYRWGHLTVTVGADEVGAVNGETVYSKAIGGQLDGYLSYDELREHVTNVAWPPAEEDE